MNSLMGKLSSYLGSPSKKAGVVAAAETTTTPKADAAAIVTTPPLGDDEKGQATETATSLTDNDKTHTDLKQEVVTDLVALIHPQNSNNEASAPPPEPHHPWTTAFLQSISSDPNQCAVDIVHNAYQTQLIPPDAIALSLQILAQRILLEVQERQCKSWMTTNTTTTMDMATGMNHALNMNSTLNMNSNNMSMFSMNHDPQLVVGGGIHNADTTAAMNATNSAMRTNMPMFSLNHDPGLVVGGAINNTVMNPTTSTTSGMHPTMPMFSMNHDPGLVVGGGMSNAAGDSGASFYQATPAEEEEDPGLGVIVNTSQFTAPAATAMPPAFASFDVPSAYSSSSYDMLSNPYISQQHQQHSSNIEVDAATRPKLHYTKVLELPVEQLDKKTGQVLKRFPNGLAAQASVSDCKQSHFFYYALVGINKGTPPHIYKRFFWRLAGSDHCPGGCVCTLAATTDNTADPFQSKAQSSDNKNYKRDPLRDAPVEMLCLKTCRVLQKFDTAEQAHLQMCESGPAQFGNFKKVLEGKGHFHHHIYKGYFWRLEGSTQLPDPKQVAKAMRRNSRANESELENTKTAAKETTTKKRDLDRATMPDSSSSTTIKAEQKEQQPVQADLDDAATSEVDTDFPPSPPAKRSKRGHGGSGMPDATSRATSNAEKQPIQAESDRATCDTVVPPSPPPTKRGTRGRGRQEQQQVKAASDAATSDNDARPPPTKRSTRGQGQQRVQADSEAAPTTSDNDVPPSPPKRTSKRGHGRQEQQKVEGDSDAATSKDTDVPPSPPTKRITRSRPARKSYAC